MQHVQAESAAKEIEQYLRAIEIAVADATKLPWGRPGWGQTQKREEFYRLMAVLPAVMEVHEFDRDGLERLRVSRSEVDRVDSGLAAADDLKPLLQALPIATAGRVGASAASAVPMPSASTPSAAGSAAAASSAGPSLRPYSPTARYSPTFYREGATPYVHIALRDNGPAGSVTVATVNLRFLADVVSGLRVGEQGHIYVVDPANHLIAHPRPTHALRKLDLASFEPVVLARRSLASGDASARQAMNSVDIDGNPVIVTAVRVAAPDWLVFVEQPRSEALAPALATLWRTLALTAVGVALAVWASIAFARRMAAPIVELSHTARRIAAGDLEARTQTRTGDEVQQLAEDFNHMADELQASYRGLESKVEARTAELSAALTEVGLRRDQAERANAAKTRFLAAASHDLRQPMHSIGLLVGVLHERLDQPEQRALANKVQRSVGVMENLFSSLLDISKLDSGAVKPNVETFAIDDLLAPLEHAYAPLAAAKCLAFTVRPSRLQVRSDAALLSRMLGNLVTNAIRYTTNGRVLVAARPRGDAVALQVWDTGVGIEAAHQADIFEEFFRLHATTQDDAKGLGLGLSIVQRTAELLGHPLRVRSVPGHGSMFEVCVPRTGHETAPGMSEASTPADAEVLRGAFVLVVDDDGDNCDALAALCRQWGCTVLTASGHNEALQALAGHLRSPDLILTDHRLGGSHDGFGLIEAVHQALDQPVPAIVVTADTDAALALRAHALGAALLHKPAGIDQLLRAVLAALGNLPDDSLAARPVQGG